MEGMAEDDQLTDEEMDTEDETNVANGSPRKAKPKISKREKKKKAAAAKKAAENKNGEGK